MKIILAGPKAAGKSGIGKIVAERLELPFVETDDIIGEIYEEEQGEKLTCREIWKKIGDEAFRELERRAVERVSKMDWLVVSTGGSTMLNPKSRNLLRRDSIIIELTAPLEVLWERIEKLGLPPFLEGSDGKEKLSERVSHQYEAIDPIAHVVVDTSEGSQQDVAERIIEGIEAELLLRADQPNTFGEVIRVSTFGESHGSGVGAVLDGVPAGVPISEEDIQKELARRRPGQSSVTTPRNELDQVHILSGMFEGKTTGHPIAMVVYNKDQDSSRYDNLREVFRPGHADFTFWKKYGIRDHRGGGRTSGRETTGRVAAGAIAKQILAERGITFVAHAVEIAGIRTEKLDHNQIEQNPVRSADPEAAKLMEEAILAARADEDSVGGIVQLEVKGVPPGIGDPVFWKLQSRLGAAILSIGAIKGIEFGSGFASARKRGSENNDPIRDGKFLSNNAGGILGGVSTGQDIILRAAVKPTSSISRTQQSMNIRGENIDLKVEGRHDPCIVPRVIPVIESMAALVILDALLIQERLSQRRA